MNDILTCLAYSLIHAWWWSDMCWICLRTLPGPCVYVFQCVLFILAAAATTTLEIHKTYVIHTHVKITIRVENMLFIHGSWEIQQIAACSWCALFPGRRQHHSCTDRYQLDDCWGPDHKQAPAQGQAAHAPTVSPQGPLLYSWGANRIYIYIYIYI